MISGSTRDRTPSSKVITLGALPVSYEAMVRSEGLEPTLAGSLLRRASPDATAWWGGMDLNHRPLRVAPERSFTELPPLEMRFTPSRPTSQKWEATKHPASQALAGRWDAPDGHELASVVALGLDDGRVDDAPGFEAGQDRTKLGLIRHGKDDRARCLGKGPATPHGVEGSALTSGVYHLSFPNPVRKIAPKHDVVKQDGGGGPLSS
jgi:hypothetical protein